MTDFYGPWKDYAVNEFVNRYRFMIPMPDDLSIAQEWIMNRLHDEFDHALFCMERITWRSFADVLARYNTKATQIAEGFIAIHGISPITPGAFARWIMRQQGYYADHYHISDPM